MRGIFDLYRIASSSSGVAEYVISPVMSGIPESYSEWYNANGIYKIYDSSKTGTERIWKHETEEFYVRYVYGMWVLVTSPTSTSYSLYISNYSGSYPAPYDEITGESYTWTYQGSANSSITFELETYGNTNFFLKDPTDEYMLYNGIYVQQKKKGIDYMIPCSDGQIWIQNPTFELNEANKSTRCALWCDGSNYILGTVNLDSSGNIIEKTSKYTVVGNGTWPWKIIEQFGDGSLSIKKTKDNSLIIPQGIEIQDYSYPVENTIGEYPYRSVSGNVFPVEGDVFYMYDGSGSKVICYKDSYSNQLRWGIRQNDSTYDSYYADAEWSWPNKCKFGQSYGGSANIPIVTIGTGETNIRILPIDKQTDTFSDFGVYRRLSEFQNNGYNITFDYINPVVHQDKIDGNNIHSYAKVWIKASEYDSFMASAPMGEDSFNAIIMMNPGESNIELVDSATNSDNSPYASNYYCFGTVVKGVGTTYLTVTSIKGFFYAPKMFWPWELDNSFYTNTNILRTDLESDPPAPPYAMIIDCEDNLRISAYYGNRQINNTNSPTNGDAWIEGSLERTSEAALIQYNGSNKRWEIYYANSTSHQYVYSSETTEFWPDNPNLTWYNGDRGISSVGSSINVNITATNDDLIADRLVVDRMWCSGNESFFGEAWPAFNMEVDPNNPPDLKTSFRYITPSYGYVWIVHIVLIDGLYYWRISRSHGNERQALAQLSQTVIGASSLEELGWPWDRYDWEAHEPGGQGMGNAGIAPASFSLKGTDITQNYGTFTGSCTASLGSIQDVNGVYQIKSSSIEERPKTYSKAIFGRWQLSICWDNGYTNEVRWILSYRDDETYLSKGRRPFLSSSFSLDDLKWPWEVTWYSDRNNYDPAPVFTKYGATTRGMYWGDQIILKQNDDSTQKNLDFSSGVTVPNRVTVINYDDKIFSAENPDDTTPVSGRSPFDGIYVNSPELLLYEDLQEYDVIYLSEKTDKRTYISVPETGEYFNVGYDGGKGVILGKYDKENDTFDWFLTGIFGLNKVLGSYHHGYGYFTYVARGRYPTDLKWYVEEGLKGGGQLSGCQVTIDENSSDSNSTVPTLVPKASYQWKSSDNMASIIWNTIEKRYELTLDGHTYNSVTFNEETPYLFPWELTEKQWNNIPYELGIKGSRVLVEGTNTVNGLYYSLGFGGKFSDSISEDNYFTQYHVRESNTYSVPHDYARFVLENSGGPQWKLYGGPSNSSYTRFVRQNRMDWEAGVTYETLTTPYDFSLSYHARRDAKVGNILPSFGHVIPNGQIDYETVAYFGIRFSMNIKKDNGEAYTVPFVYSSSDIGFNGYPVIGQKWTGTYESDNYIWQWNETSNYWEMLVNGEAVLNTVVRTGNQPDLFPWEYRVYEYSTWTKSLDGAGYVIISASTNGSRIVITGGAESEYNDPVNGSYVSYYINPDDYIDSEYDSYRWINERGGSFGRFNSSTRWQFTGIGDQIYAVDRNKLPWVDEDFTTNSSYSLKPSNFLINGRPKENTTGFASMYEVYGSEQELNGSYVLVGYTYASEDVFDILTYRNTSTGTLLRRENSIWTLSLNGVVKYQASDATLHYPQDTEVTWEATSSGASNTTPYIVAVDGMTKIPAVNNWNMTVADAGEASVNGTYTEDHLAGAYGIDRSWTSESGSIIKYTDSTWGIYTSDALMYAVDATQLEDGTSSDPYGEKGVTLTWTVESGAEPVPSVTAEVVLDTITVSGASDDAINGVYNLVDDTAEGDDRIWTNGSYYIARGTSYKVWMVRNISDRPSDPGSSGVYFYGSETSKDNPYNDDGTSYNWYSMRGSGTLSVIKEN